MLFHLRPVITIVKRSFPNHKLIPILIKRRHKNRQNRHNNPKKSAGIRKNLINLANSAVNTDRLRREQEHHIDILEVDHRFVVLHFVAVELVTGFGLGC